MLLGGDLTWNTSALISTVDYCDQFFDLGNQNTHLAIGNHDVSNITNLLSYTQKEGYYSFNKNNITFIVLDTELATPNISGSQLDLIRNVSDSIEYSHYLVVILHRILWMVDNSDLAYLQNSVGGSSSNLNSSNFFEEVYPEFQKVKNKGIPIFCIAGDRTNVNIEYSIEDSIQVIASGMIDYLSDENNYSIVLTYLPETKKLNYEFVPLSELDTMSDETTVLGGLENNAKLDLNLFPNPVSDQITIQLNEKNHDIIKIEIFSSVGKKLLEASIAGGNDSFSLNLSSLDNSLYYSYISNKNKAQIEKIIVNNPTF